MIRHYEDAEFRYSLGPSGKTRLAIRKESDEDGGIQNEIQIQGFFDRLRISHYLVYYHDQNSSQGRVVVPKALEHCNDLFTNPKTFDIGKFDSLADGERDLDVRETVGDDNGSEYEPSSSSRSSRRPSADRRYTRAQKTRSASKTGQRRVSASAIKSNKRARATSVVQSGAAKKLPRLQTIAPTDLADSNPNPVSELPRKDRVNFIISDTKAFEDFVMYTFKAILQKPGKDILTEWIRVIQPKKQTAFPYSRGKDDQDREVVPFDENVHPSWWPTRDTNEGKMLDVPFIEPHHLKKHNRLALALHLTMLMDSEMGIRNSQQSGRHIDQNAPYIGMLELATQAIYQSKLREENEPEEKYRHRMSILKQFWRVAKEREMWEQKMRLDDTVVEYDKYAEWKNAVKQYQPQEPISEHLGFQNPQEHLDAALTSLPHRKRASAAINRNLASPSLPPDHNPHRAFAVDRRPVPVAPSEHGMPFSPPSTTTIDGRQELLPANANSSYSNERAFQEPEIVHHRLHPLSQERSSFIEHPRPIARLGRMLPCSLMGDSMPTDVTFGPTGQPQHMDNNYSLCPRAPPYEYPPLAIRTGGFRNFDSECQPNAGVVRPHRFGSSPYLETASTFDASPVPSTPAALSPNSGFAATLPTAPTAQVFSAHKLDFDFRAAPIHAERSVSDPSAADAMGYQFGGFNPASVPHGMPYFPPVPSTYQFQTQSSDNSFGPTQFTFCQPPS